MNFQLDADMVKTNIEEKLLAFRCAPGHCHKGAGFRGCMTVRDILTRKRGEFKHVANLNGAKRVYYLCMEFMLGRSLRTNLCNLGLSGIYSEVLGKLGFDIEEIYDIEPDAGLGSGGLGRLAACFMDSLSSLNYPATGFSICYEYGLFRQNNRRDSDRAPDILLRGEVWLIPRTDRAFVVRFGGRVKEVWKEGRASGTLRGLRRR